MEQQFIIGTISITINPMVSYFVANSKSERRHMSMTAGSEQHQVLVVASGKGGVGKTTTVANVSCALARMGLRVAVVDLDIGLKKLDLIMGLENRVIYDIVQVIEGECTLKQALVKDKRFPGLYMLPAAQTRNKDDISPDQVKGVCSQLKEEFDYVLVDCPAGIEQGFRNAIAAADRAIVVTNPEVSAVRDADRIIGMLESNGFQDIKLIVNRVHWDMVRNGDMLSIEDVAEHLYVDLIGVIPEDQYVVVSTNKGEPIVLNDKSRAGAAFDNVARRIVGEEVPILPPQEPSWWGRIKNFSRGIFSGH
jgi:septum site-determining protein MinD